MKNWMKLCEMINPFIRKGVDEDIYHTLFESCLKLIFNWDDKNIKHKLPVPMGRETKEADIVLEGNGFGIVVEMKRPTIELGEKEASQLTSYMRFLRYKYGLLIGNKFKIFYDEDINNDDPVEIASFSFDVNNLDGEDFCNILDVAICSDEKLKEFSAERIKRIKIKKEMELLKFDLVKDNGEKIKQIIKDKYINDGLDENNIADILDDINISLTEAEFEYSDTSAIGNNVQKSERTITPAVMAETFYFSRNNSKASLKIQGKNDFVLLRGSKIASIVQSFSTSHANRRKYKHLISPAFETIQDITFSTPSGAASFVSGASDNGWIGWKTSSGKSIDDMITGK